MTENRILKSFFVETKEENIQKNLNIFLEILNFKQSLNSWIPFNKKINSNDFKSIKDNLKINDSISENTNLVIASSGSTDTPKGVELSSKAIINSIKATEKYFNTKTEWTLAVPANYIAGMQVILRSIYNQQIPKIIDIENGFNVADLIQIVSKFNNKPQAISLLPNQLHKISLNKEGLLALKEFDFVLTGGAALDNILYANLKSKNINIIRGYGMSETCGGCVYDGVPLEGVSIKINPNTEQIMLKGDILFNGYRNNSDHYLENGWYTTNDIGIFTKNKLQVKGRIDNIINSGGLKIIPEEIESKFLEIPEISNCVIFGKNDNIFGEIPVAILETKITDKKIILELAYKNLSRKRIPKEIILLKEFPKLHSGKIDRRKLKQIYG